MVNKIREVEKTLGVVKFSINDSDRYKRRSLFAIKDIEKGDLFSHENVRSLRPGVGLHPKQLDVIIGEVSPKNFRKGDPINL